MKFGNPQYLYLLPLLLGGVLLLHWLARRAARRKRARFGRPELVKTLMPDASPAKGWVHLGLQLALVTLATLILARPLAGKSHETTTIHGIEMIVAVDVSNSMLAGSSSESGDVSRLMRAKLIAERLIDHSATDKVGLVVFAGNAYMQMPVTTDLRAAKLFLSNLSTDMAPTQGTAIGTAIRLASQSFSPSKKSQKAIIVITDGENFEDDAVAEARAAASDGRQVAPSLGKWMKPNNRADTTNAIVVFHRSSTILKTTPRKITSSPTATPKKSMKACHCGAQEKVFHDTVAQPSASMVLMTRVI